MLGLFSNDSVDSLDSEVFAQCNGSFVGPFAPDQRPKIVLEFFISSRNCPILLVDYISNDDKTV